MQNCSGLCESAKACIPSPREEPLASPIKPWIRPPPLFWFHSSVPCWGCTQVEYLVLVPQQRTLLGLYPGGVPCSGSIAAAYLAEVVPRWSTLSWFHSSSVPCWGCPCAAGSAGCRRRRSGSAAARRGSGSTGRDTRPSPGPRPALPAAMHKHVKLTTVSCGRCRIFPRSFSCDAQTRVTRCSHWVRVLDGTPCANCA